MNDKEKLIVIIVTVSMLILFISGMMFGRYVYGYKGETHPLVDGIKEINEDNKAYFICTCMSSEEGKRISFNFDQEEIHEAYFGN